MDPTNPRWQTSDERWHRNATFWKIIVGATAASAFTAVAVASCLGRDSAARDTHELTEPAYVETTAGTPAPVAQEQQLPEENPAPADNATPGAVIIVNNHAPAGPAPTTTADSTGGAAAVGQTETTAAGAAPAATGGSVTVIHGTPRANYNYSPRPVPYFETVSPAATDAPVAAAAPVAGHAGHAENDPKNRPAQPMTTAGPAGTPVAPGTAQSKGSNPAQPSMQAGAGPFITEAPFWTSSAMTPNRDAGAGAFDTERNRPAPR